MEINLLCVGKSDRGFIEEGIDEYLKRLKFYAVFKIEYIPDIKKSKKSSPHVIRKQEGRKILEQIDPSDYLILLDEKGKDYSSRAFASHLEHMLMHKRNKIIFLIGGAYGFDEAIYARANETMSFSRLTFTHQMIRLFFVEQLYRAFTIIKNEKYHN